MRPSSSRSVRKGCVRQLARVKDEIMTTEEYLQTAETLKPTELIYGVLRVADSPLAPHQAAVRDLSLSLVSYVLNDSSAKSGFRRSTLSWTRHGTSLCSPI